jgi:hypothetical protein
MVVRIADINSKNNWDEDIKPEEDEADLLESRLIHCKTPKRENERHVKKPK